MNTFVKHNIFEDFKLLLTQNVIFNRQYSVLLSPFRCRKSFNKLLTFVEKNSALQRNVTTEEVGNTAAFLCSELASGITGEITYVDGGFNMSGLGKNQ